MFRSVYYLENKIQRVVLGRVLLRLKGITDKLDDCDKTTSTTIIYREFCGSTNTRWTKGSFLIQTNDLRKIPFVEKFLRNLILFFVDHEMINQELQSIQWSDRQTMLKINKVHKTDKIIILECIHGNVEKTAFMHFGKAGFDPMLSNVEDGHEIYFKGVEYVDFNGKPCIMIDDWWYKR